MQWSEHWDAPWRTEGHSPGTLLLNSFFVLGTTLGPGIVEISKSGILLIY